LNNLTWNNFNWPSQLAKDISSKTGERLMDLVKLFMKYDLITRIEQDKREYKTLVMIKVTKVTILLAIMA
jgi:hypothetical protein